MPYNVKIDEVDVDKDRLFVHGKNLVTLIEENNFIQCLYHVIVGHFPTLEKEKKLNDLLVSAVKIALSNNKKMELLLKLKKEIFSCECFIINAITIFDNSYGADFSNEVSRIFDVVEAERKDIENGLFIIGIVPLMIHVFLFGYNAHKTPQLITAETNSFSAMLLKLLKNEATLNDNEIWIFDKMLISLHAGFGSVTPTIALARFSASTFAEVIFNLIAGITGCGPAHVGACKNAMKLYNYLIKLNYNDEKIFGYIRAEISKGKKIPGFGHPLLNIDPRNTVLEKIMLNYAKQKHMNLYAKIKSFMLTTYKLNPNIDSILAAMLLSLGVSENIGTCLFLFARMPTMLAHAIQKKKSPAFGIRKDTARAKIKSLPDNWL
jgi:citrate synthase